MAEHDRDEERHRAERSRDERRRPQRDRPDPESEPVEEASDESFPASDPPAWVKRPRDEAAG